MCSSTIDAHGSTNSGGKIPLLRIVKTTRMERFSWLVMGVIVLATGVIFLTDQTQRSSFDVVGQCSIDHRQRAGELDRGAQIGAGELRDRLIEPLTQSDTFRGCAVQVEIVVRISWMTPCKSSTESESRCCTSVERARGTVPCRASPTAKSRWMT